MRARRICLLTALTFAAVCCTPAGGPAPVAPPPPAGWSGPGPVPPPRRMRLFFGGDVMQHMPQVDAVRRGDDVTIFGGKTGLLYGAYWLLMALASGSALPEDHSSAPQYALRMINCWDLSLIHI